MALRTPWKLFLLATCALILTLLTGCGRQPSTSVGKMLVVAGIPPMASFAKAVGGDLVDVKLMVPPGASPHTYQPQPDQMKALAKASVLVLNGAGLEFWADKAVDAVGNPKLIVVRTSDGLKLVGSSDEDHHAGGNPHVWLDPVYAVHQVEAIRDAFIKADPSHKADYTRNAANYIDRLNALDREIRAQTKAFQSKDFIAFHPSWVYFAHRYGLKEAAVIEQSPGREPTPSELRLVIDTARKIKARAIFAEPQFSPKAAEVIADEAGAKVLFLDPLGKPPDYDYIKTMRANLKQMAEALR